jgi:hypothetical protein
VRATKMGPARVDGGNRAARCPKTGVRLLACGRAVGRIRPPDNVFHARSLFAFSEESNRVPMSFRAPTAVLAWYTSEAGILDRASRTKCRKFWWNRSLPTDPAGAADDAVELVLSGYPCARRDVDRRRCLQQLTLAPSFRYKQWRHSRHKHLSHRRNRSTNHMDGQHGLLR